MNSDSVSKQNLVGIEQLARPEIRAMKPYSSARKEAPGKGILLNANEAPRDLLSEQDPVHGLNRYPDPQPGELLARLAKLYGVSEDQLLVTRGSDEGIDLLVRVFCRAGVDAIAQVPPTFGMYRIAAQAQGADCVSIDRDAAGGFTFPMNEVCSTLLDDDRIRLLFLTSPNNPTGDVIQAADIISLAEQARGQALVVVDEAYAEFSNQPSATELLAGHPNLVVLRTLSKAWGAAGLRCGTVIAQPAVLDLLRRIIAPYPLPQPVVALALRMLENDVLEQQRGLLQEIEQGKQYLLEDLQARSFVLEMLPGQANFVLIRVNEAEELLGFCAERNLILRGFPADPRLKNHIRISVGSRADLEALSRAFDEWENKQ